MKSLFLISLLLFIYWPGLGQITNGKSANPQIEQLEAKIQALKNQKSSIGRDTLIATCYYQLTRQKDLGFPAIKAYIDSALELSSKLKWKKGIGFAYWAMANLADEKQAAGFWDETDELKSKAVNYYQSIHDTSSLINAKASLANNLWDLGHFDRSIKILYECLQYAEAKNDVKRLTYLYEDLGNNYISKKIYSKGLYFYEKSYSLRDAFFSKVSLSKKDSLIRLAVMKTNLIVGYFLNNQKEKAEFMIPWVENINDLYGGNFERYRSNSLITFSYIEIGDFKKAEKYALKCSYYAKILASRAHDLVVNTYFSKIYKGLGKYEMALKYFEELKKVESEIAFDKMNAKVTELDFKYNNEASNKTINELTIEKQKQTEKFLFGSLLILAAIVTYALWNNKKLKQKNIEISQALLKGQTTERHRVALDLHDNLGSTLSSIGYSMEAIDKSKMSDTERDIYKNLQEMVTKAYNDVRLLSHNLLPEDFEKIGLRATLESFIRKINKNSALQFQLIIDENFGRVDKKIEFELYSICMELVNNIIKHSKATEAKIELSKTENQIKLLVSDNGIGIFKNESDGKGLKNVQARVDSVGGAWKVRGGTNEGIINEINVSYKNTK